MGLESLHAMGINSLGHGQEYVVAGTTDSALSEFALHGALTCSCVYLLSV